jgi:hypothetical protein
MIKKMRIMKVKRRPLPDALGLRRTWNEKY